MKILISRLSSGKDVVGGAEYSAKLHKKVLNQLGYKTDFYTNAKFFDIKHAYVPNIKLMRWVWLWWVLPLKALFGRYDIINPHSREDQIIFTLTKWLHRTPVVWKDPGDLVHNIKLVRKGLLGRINQHFLLKAIEKADAIYTLNSEDRSIILERLAKLGHKIDNSKISVIPSDILFADYNLSASPPNLHRHILQNNGTSREDIIKNNAKPFVIGTVIRLDEHKGVQYLLQATHELNKRHDNLEFWIVGDGPFRAELESLAADLKNVLFWGHQDDISPFLAGMDIFIQPAEFEGWGRNVKEAMYFAKPVIGSDVGGIATQIDNGQTGLLFEPKNVQQLTRLIGQLIKDKKLRQKLGENAQTKVKQDGDYVNLVKNHILPLFESALNKQS